MAGKRSATSDLNADNWNQEDEPEEAGTFTKAATEVLQKRVIKTAKRRHTNLQTDDEPANNAFGTFSGFKTTSVSSSPFRFLASTKPTDPLATNKTTVSKVEATNGSIPLKENGIDNSQPKDNANKNSVPSENNKTLPKRPPEYYAKLKGLNQSVAQWIKTHVDSNPVCILTPIFRDYEKHLKEIETKHGFEVNKEIASNENKESKEHSNTTLSAITPSKQEEKLINFKGESKSSPLLSKVSLFSCAMKESNSPFSSISTEKNPFLCNPVVIDSKPNENTKVEERASSGIFSQESASSVNFNFGSQSSSISTAGFSFGGNKPFSFGAQVAAPEAENKKNENDQNQDEDDEPPKPDFKPVTEEGSVYEQRCKVFIKKDGKFSDRGIGTLFLKPTPNDKIQLIVRGTNSLGNLILNFLLTESIPIKRMNSTNIMLVCLPMPDFEPPPTAILLRVKTEEDADTLLETLNKHKK